MDKDQEQRPTNPHPPPNESISSSMPRRTLAARSLSTSISQDMKRPMAISGPVTIPSQSSWDVETLGSPPRKGQVPRAPTPLLSRSFSGKLLSRSSSSASTRKASRAPESLSGVLSRSSSSASRQGVKTPDLYNGDSEGSEELPPTPRSARSPTPTSTTGVAPTPSYPPSTTSSATITLSSAFTASPNEEPRRKSAESNREDPEAKAEREQFVYQRETIYHHRFPREQVPYMQSYSQMSFQNDLYTHELLRKLMPETSPTFHEYFGQVPTEVLDIGCGRGLWAAEAATMWKWKNCNVTAFDVVDLGRPMRQSLDPEISAQIQWVQGNLLEELPFPSSAFGLVRIACMALAVPLDCWRHILTEARRVLKPGGRLEVIDDELLFPAIQYPFKKPTKNGSSRMKSSPTQGFDSDDEVEESISSASIRRSPPTSAGGKVHSKDSSPQKSESRNEFHTSAVSAINMENLFQSMLYNKYDIMPRPHRHIEDLMLSIFGSGRSNCMARADIFLPKSDAFLDKGKSKLIPTKFSGRSSARPSLDNEEAPPCSSLSMPPKALRVLGGAGTAAPYQPPGYIIWPDTFVLCDPETLEMYACKSVHTVLSSKHALATFVQEQVDTAGQPFVTDAQFDDLTWTYDTFKRARFNWPETYSGFNLDEETTPVSAGKPLFNRPDGSIFSRRRVASGATPLVQQTIVKPQLEDLIPIRRIRVFQGIKAGPGTDAVELIPLPSRSEE